MELTVIRYSDDKKEIWDRFVLQESMNGTFLQSRRFLEYHPAERFEDHSLLIYKGNEVIAVVPACKVINEGKTMFFSHKGSTYGGIVLKDKFYNVSYLDAIMETLESYLKDCGFEAAYMKMTPDVFCKKPTPLVDYFLYKNNWTNYDELNFFMRLEDYKDGVAEQFTSGKRRDYRYSLKAGMEFRQLETDEELAEFHAVLSKNLGRLGVPVVHSLAELKDLKRNRLNENIDFYGVYLEGKMIAGSMLFKFENKVCHTQYLASDEDYRVHFPMEFLIFNLISKAVEEDMEVFTFGICTEDQGRYLNMGLSRFKEGFGAEYGINRSYEKIFR